MTDRQVKFEKVPYKSPKIWLYAIRKRLGIHFSTKVKVGEVVVISLPPKGMKFHFYYLGDESPEITYEDEWEVGIIMPKTVLVYVRQDPTKIMRFKVEVYIAR